MSERTDLLRRAFDHALAEQEASYERSRAVAAKRAAALAALPPEPDPREAIEDSAARVVAARHGMPLDDVEINGRRYGEIVNARTAMSGAQR